MSRHLIGRKPKVIIIYVVAMEDGTMPATPRRDAKACAAQMEVSKKYRPDATWKVFKVSQLNHGYGVFRTIGKLMVENAGNPNVELELIKQLTARHGHELRKLGVELDGDSDA